MVPLGSFAQVGAPAVPPINNSQDVVSTDPAPETPAPSLTPAPTPPVAITPPTFAAGGKTDENDDDVDYGEENGEGHDDEGDDDDDESEDDD
jgi:hypothetical protein